MHPITQVREVTRIQPQDFARLLGVQYAYLRKIECGNRPLTEDLCDRIREQFGAVISLDGRGNPVGMGPDEDRFFRWRKAMRWLLIGEDPLDYDSEPGDDVPPPYTLESYEWWLARRFGPQELSAPERAAHHKNEVNEDIRSVQRWVRILLRAADRRKCGGAMRSALGHALRKLGEDFQLGDAIALEMRRHVRDLEPQYLRRFEDFAARPRAMSVWEVCSFDVDLATGEYATNKNSETFSPGEIHVHWVPERNFPWRRPKPQEPGDPQKDQA